ncbi:MAG: ABC transporter permease subunit [Spirochaetes bacterium]|nr:ABC transporter permease subunit [Spirochaetota bacterium]
MIQQKLKAYLIKISASILKVAFLVLAIIFFASLPLVVQQSRGHLSIRPLYFFLGLDYLKNIVNGQSFIYYLTDRQMNALLDLYPAFGVSLLYISLSSIIGLLIGVPFGILQHKRRFGITQKILFFINTIPDFFLILLLQIIIITITLKTGIRFTRITASKGLPLLLPLLAMSLYPALYLIKTMATTTYEITCQDYILCAISRGFTKKHIFLREIFPALIPTLEADIHKTTIMIISNLFIAETLFLLPGITRLLFRYGFQQRNIITGGSYQYNLVVNCLLGMVIIFILVRTFLKLLLYITRKVVVHES